MSLTRTDRDRKPPFGPAVVKRGLQLQYVVEEEDPITGAISPKDISAARYTYRVRTWLSDDDLAPLHDEIVTKGTQDSSGELDHYFSCGATVRDNLKFEIVEIDNDNADATTGSSLRERILERWEQPIIDAP